jgi:hypothetical protein
MVLSVQVGRCLSLFAAIALIAASAVSQAPPKYDPATETTIKGTVGELKLVPPTGGKAIAYLVTKTGPDKEKRGRDLPLSKELSRPNGRLFYS